MATTRKPRETPDALRTFEDYWALGGIEALATGHPHIVDYCQIPPLRGYRKG